MLRIYVCVWDTWVPMSTQPSNIDFNFYNLKLNYFDISPISMVHQLELPHSIFIFFQKRIIYNPK